MTNKMPVQPIHVLPVDDKDGVEQASEEQEFLKDVNISGDEACKSSESSDQNSEIDKMHVINFHGSDNCVTDLKRSVSCISTVSSAGEFCRICHCERTESSDQPLIRPCLCSGTLMFVHQSCLQKWIKSSDIKKCELCKYQFHMEAKVKPFRKWQSLKMTHSERRKILCSVSFHVIAITCVVWSLWVLIERTAQEIRDGHLDWPFWTKLVVVAIGFTGGLVFMYVQCKVYVQLWKRLRAFNRIILVKNVSEEDDVTECI